MMRRLALLLVLLAHGVAHADDPKEEAQRQFGLASAAHKDGRFHDALNALMVAYSFDPRPELLYAIAQVHVKLGQCPQAILYYQRFLASHPKPEHEVLAQKAIQICKTNPPPAEVVSQDDPSRPREELGLAAAEELRKAKEAEAFAATEHRKAEEARIAAERDRERNKLYDRHPARRWAIIGGSVGAGALIAGGVFALSARSAQSDFDTAGCGERTQRLDGPELGACQDAIDRGEQRARIGNILLAAGGAVLATSITIFVLDPGNLERPERANAALTLTPTSVSFVARW